MAKCPVRSSVLEAHLPWVDGCWFIIVALKFKGPPGMCHKCVSPRHEA